MVAQHNHADQHLYGSRFSARHPPRREVMGNLPPARSVILSGAFNGLPLHPCCSFIALPVQTVCSLLLVCDLVGGGSGRPRSGVGVGQAMTPSSSAPKNRDAAGILWVSTKRLLDGLYLVLSDPSSLHWIANRTQKPVKTMTDVSCTSTSVSAGVNRLFLKKFGLVSWCTCSPGNV